MNTPLTSGQFRYSLSLQSPKPIVVVTGPAGTGKTLLACDFAINEIYKYCLLYTSPSPRDRTRSRMPSSA